jgi:hypothetical protein
MKAPIVSMCVLGIVCLFTNAQAAKAWGCRGHQTVAYLAEKHLTPEAKQMFQNLLTDNPIDPTLKRYCGNAVTDVFADAATWADDERTKAPKTAPWHFIDIPLGASRDQVKDSCGATGCVTQAIVDQLAILKDTTASASDRAQALRFIIHFVGDLHQPLHATTNSDRGSNCVPIKYLRRNPHASNGSYTPNLHAIWDTDMVERDMEGASPAEFADTLDTKFKSLEAKWTKEGMQLEAWAWEGHQFAEATSYGALSVKIAVEPTVPVEKCTDDNDIGERMLELHEAAGQTYQNAAAPVIEQRLAQAGVRLAMILNDAAKANP